MLPYDFTVMDTAPDITPVFTVPRVKKESAHHVSHLLGGKGIFLREDTIRLVAKEAGKVELKCR